MLKSLKMRALATVGAVAFVAPFTFTGAALAAPGTAVITTATPASGPPGQPVQLNGSGCTSGSGATNTVALFLRGPSGSSNLVGQAAGVVQANGTFTGTLTVPTNAIPGDTYSITAQCSDVTGPGTVSTATTFTVTGGSILTGSVTAGLTTATGGVTSSGLTSTSGTTTGTTAGVTTATTVGATTGVATPIVATPTFTG